MSFETLDRDKQNKIINAACEIFAKYGYKKASIKNIAEAAEISKSVLFKYFSTKENLYMTIFRMASDSIRKADDTAREALDKEADMFTIMRHSAKSRLSLFKEFPWIYKFSYTATFDHDPFVQSLVKKEIDNYKKHLANSNDSQADENNNADENNITDGFGGFKGLREDISPAAARQLILWISMGYLEDKLNKGEMDPEGLEQGFEEWIETLEILLKAR